MIYEAIMYGIKCDRCHEILENSDGYTVMPDKGDMNDDASDENWYVDGEKHYCPNCYSRDENDVVTVKPAIHYTFFRFWHILKTLTSLQYRFRETETHYILTNSYCYKKLNNARLSILRDIISDFVVEYKTPSNISGRPYEIETISIPKNYKPKLS